MVVIRRGTETLVQHADKRFRLSFRPALLQALHSTQRRASPNEFTNSHEKLHSPDLSGCEHPNLSNTGSNSQHELGSRVIVLKRPVQQWGPVLRPAGATVVSARRAQLPQLLFGKIFPKLGTSPAAHRTCHANLRRPLRPRT